MKKNLALQNAVSFAVGFLFSVGLAFAGMTQPQKIISFLNPWAWDPSLIFVMLGAVGVHIIAYPLVRKRKSPLLDSHWHVPTRSEITPSLILGSAIFGIGWGLGGFCPGPGLASVFVADLRPISFVIAMVIGMMVYTKSKPYLKIKD